MTTFLLHTLCSITFGVMSVAAIRCEACQGTGQWPQLWPDWRDKPMRCLVCNGTGTERPPQDHDRTARKAIEGKTDDNG